MAVKVVDASAIAAVLFGEAEGEEITARIVNANLVAPTLFSMELAQVCLKKARREPAKQTALTHALHRRRRLPIVEMNVDPDAALDLAFATGLTVYDASYLWLARDLAVELVSLDRQLIGAATTH